MEGERMELTLEETQSERRKDDSDHVTDIGIPSAIQFLALPNFFTQQQTLIGR